MAEKPSGSTDLRLITTLELKVLGPLLDALKLLLPQVDLKGDAGMFEISAVTDYELPTDIVKGLGNLAKLDPQAFVALNENIQTLNKNILLLVKEQRKAYAVSIGLEPEIKSEFPKTDDVSLVPSGRDELCNDLLEEKINFEGLTTIGDCIFAILLFRKGIVKKEEIETIISNQTQFSLDYTSSLYHCLRKLKELGKIKEGKTSTNGLYELSEEFFDGVSSENNNFFTKDLDLNKGNKKLGEIIIIVLEKFSYFKSLSVGLIRNYLLQNGVTFSCFSLNVLLCKMVKDGLIKRISKGEYRIVGDPEPPSVTPQKIVPSVELLKDITFESDEIDEDKFKSQFAQEFLELINKLGLSDGPGFGKIPQLCTNAVILRSLKKEDIGRFSEIAFTMALTIGEISNSKNKLLGICEGNLLQEGMLMIMVFLMNSYGVLFNINFKIGGINKNVSWHNVRNEMEKRLKETCQYQIENHPDLKGKGVEFKISKMDTFGFESLVVFEVPAESNTEFVKIKESLVSIIPSWKEFLQKNILLPFFLLGDDLICVNVLKK